MAHRIPIKYRINSVKCSSCAFCTLWEHFTEKSVSSLLYWHSCIFAHINISSLFDYIVIVMLLSFQAL